MIKLTYVRYDENDEHYTGPFYINEDYIVGFIPLLIHNKSQREKTKVWIDPSVCIKGIGIGPSQDVMETWDEIMRVIDYAKK